MNKQNYYFWTNNKTRLKRIDEETKAVILVNAKSKGIYHIHGKYTAHDVYMGNPIGEHLSWLIHILKKEGIAYQLEEQATFEASPSFWLLSSYLVLEKKNFEHLKRVLKM